MVCSSPATVAERSAPRSTHGSGHSLGPSIASRTRTRSPNFSMDLVLHQATARVGGTARLHAGYSCFAAHDRAARSRTNPYRFNQHWHSFGCRCWIRPHGHSTRIRDHRADGGVGRVQCCFEQAAADTDCLARDSCYGRMKEGMRTMRMAGHDPRQGTAMGKWYRTHSGWSHRFRPHRGHGIERADGRPPNPGFFFFFFFFDQRSMSPARSFRRAPGGWALPIGTPSAPVDRGHIAGRGQTGRASISDINRPRSTDRLAAVRRNEPPQVESCVNRSGCCGYDTRAYALNCRTIEWWFQQAAARLRSRACGRTRADLEGDREPAGCTGRPRQRRAWRLRPALSAEFKLATRAGRPPGAARNRQPAVLPASASAILEKYMRRRPAASRRVAECQAAPA